MMSYRVFCILCLCASASATGAGAEFGITQLLSQLNSKSVSLALSCNFWLTLSLHC